MKAPRFGTFCCLVCLGVWACGCQSQSREDLERAFESAGGADGGAPLVVSPTGRVIAEVRVNGAEAGPFMLGTALRAVAVSPAVGRKLELRELAAVERETTGGEVSVEAWEADVVEAGGVRARDVLVVELEELDSPFSPRVTGTRVSGVLGLPVLERAVVDVDFVRREGLLVVREAFGGRDARPTGDGGSTRDGGSTGDGGRDGGRAARPTEGDDGGRGARPTGYEDGGGDAHRTRGGWHPLVIRNRLPLVECEFDGERGLFLLDTSIGPRVLFLPGAEERFPMLAERQSGTAVRLGVGGVHWDQRGEVERFEIGGMVRDDVEVVFAKRPPVRPGLDEEVVGMVGVRMFEGWRLVLDVGGGRFAVARAREHSSGAKNASVAE